MSNIADKISELNKEGICTAGLGTFGCGCPKCLEEILVEFEK